MTKWHLGLTPWPGIENTITGKVVASPSPGRDEFYESVFVRGSFTHQKCSNYALTNLLFGLCRFVWIIDLLIILTSLHPRVPTHSSTPKVLQAKELAPNLSPSIVFNFGFTFESIKKSKGKIVLKLT